MPAFDFSGIVKTKNPDYGFLVDQLDIKRNQLGSDGKLSPGDYGLLIKQAQEIYAHPGLSRAQRSSVLVKISQYEQEQKTSRQKDLGDIARLNRELEDDDAKNTMLYGNNPSIFLRATSDALRLKLDRLSQSIDVLINSGDDSSNHMNEFNETLKQYNDTLQALDDVKIYTAGSAPASNFVAYLTTNSSGEIVNVSIGRTGSKSGYVETNGMYGGLQVYGKVNRKEFGKNIFLLGNETFSGSDLTVQDPTTPGAFRSAPLLSERTKGGKNVGMVVNQYVDVDLSQVRPQSSIRAGGWAEGPNGFLYQRLPNGKYKKYVNTDKEKLGVSPNDVIRVPAIMEQNMLPSVEETVDGSVPFTFPAVTTPAVSTSTPATSTSPSAAAPAEPVAAGTPRTPGPIIRAAQTAKGIAATAIKKAGGVLKYLFGGEE